MFCSRHLSPIPQSCPTPKGKTARRYLRTHILPAQGPKSGSKNLQDGVVDYINVEDWGNRDNGDFDVGELKTKGRVRRVLDNAQELPFMQVIANVLANAERSKQITPPIAIDRDVPPFEKWAFREDHYEQYLVDLLCVNQSMGEAVKAARREIARVQGNNNLYLDSILLDPIKMGIYRGDCIAKDIQQLRATKTEGSPEDILMPTRFASYYADILGTFCDYYTQESSSADSKNSLVAVLPRYGICASQLCGGEYLESFIYLPQVVCACIYDFSESNSNGK